jgi:hypothetical protein
MQRWETLADGFVGLQHPAGQRRRGNPHKVLSAAGIEVLEIEGLIEEAVRAVFAGESLNHMVKRSLTACGASSCSGQRYGLRLTGMLGPASFVPGRRSRLHCDPRRSAATPAVSKLGLAWNQNLPAPCQILWLETFSPNQGVTKNPPNKSSISDG